MAKFKVGDRARLRVHLEAYDSEEITTPAGTEVSVIGLPGCAPPEVVLLFPGLRFAYEIEVPSGGQSFALEEELQKLLPDSDTYHPADISIDDLMRGLRETEHA